MQFPVTWFFDMTPQEFLDNVSIVWRGSRSILDNESTIEDESDNSALAIDAIIGSSLASDTREDALVHLCMTLCFLIGERLFGEGEEVELV